MKALDNLNRSLWVVFLSSAFLWVGCTTYDTVETSSISSSLDFEDTDRFAVEVSNTSPIDTAFDEVMREEAVEDLIDALENEGFDYVGERNPDIRIAFSTYVTTKSGYIDTTQPVVKRVVESEEVRAQDGDVITTTTTTEQVTTDQVTMVTDSDPIYVRGPSRVFLLDVFDAETKVLLWRAYTLDRSTGLDEASLKLAIGRLVERLEEKS